jgi:hypothetical protein
MTEQPPRAKDAASLERPDATDPSTWNLAPTNLNSLEQRCLNGLRAKGYPATSVQMDPSKLKGGYICDTMRVFIGYSQDATHTKTAKEEVEARRAAEGNSELPKSVASRPATAILKIASPLSNDHDVAMKLRLYEREWHFYETMSSRVPVRVPTLLGSVKDEATGLLTEGVLLEDLEVPGAVLCPKLDDEGVLKTVSAMARHHAQFWNMPELSSGALGLKPHNSPWYQPGWGNDVTSYWSGTEGRPGFEAKWRCAHGTARERACPQPAAARTRFSPHASSHAAAKPTPTNTPLTALRSPARRNAARRSQRARPSGRRRRSGAARGGVRHRRQDRGVLRLGAGHALVQAAHLQPRRRQAAQHVHDVGQHPRLLRLAGP